LVGRGFDAAGGEAGGGCYEGLVPEGRAAAGALAGPPDAELLLGAVPVDGEEAGRAYDSACAEAVVRGDCGTVVGAVLLDERVAALVEDEEVVV
jgi:hypothetical protein